MVVILCAEACLRKGKHIKGSFVTTPLFHYPQIRYKSGRSLCDRAHDYHSRYHSRGWLYLRTSHCTVYIWVTQHITQDD
jgi:hypothetical protein